MQLVLLFVIFAMVYIMEVQVNVIGKSQRVFLANRIVLPYACVDAHYGFPFHLLLSGTLLVSLGIKNLRLQRLVVIKVATKSLLLLGQLLLI